MDILDTGAVTVSVFVLFAYHAVLYSSVAANVLCASSDAAKPGAKIQLSINIRNASIWLDKHKASTDAPTVTLAIQTLRNSILVAVFVGGQSFLFGFNTITSYPETVGNTRNQVRSIILSTCLFASFLNWAWVIRISSHLGYMIGTITHLVNLKTAAVQRKAEADKISAAAAAAASKDFESLPTPPLTSSPAAAAAVESELDIATMDIEIEEEMVECRKMSKQLYLCFR